MTLLKWKLLIRAELINKSQAKFIIKVLIKILAINRSKNIF
jgi:hypothetical protein